MGIQTEQNNTKSELDALRDEIHQTARNFGKEDFESDETSDEEIPISSEWSSFQGGPVQAKWVPTHRHNCTLVLFEVPADTVIDFHKHQPAESFVAVGDVTVHTPDSTERLKEGDVIKIESSEPHAAEFHADTLLTMLWTPAFPSDPSAPDMRVLYRAGGLSVKDSAGE